MKFYGAEGLGFKSGPFKLDTVVPTARYRCDIFSKGAMLPGRNDAETGPANLLHFLARYIAYNDFDLIYFVTGIALSEALFY